MPSVRDVSLIWRCRMRCSCRDRFQLGCAVERRRV